ncbi:type VI secretion system protein TssA [Tropicimonas sp. S265A]|uniref:type VI secretion system protein TssA n=1 Tax=Tropicimonas sp. S265A TaxID=3415134 RepID=UPI003C7C5B4B
MNLDELLATLDDGSGAGENLEYDPAFTELELAAQPGEERQMGDEIKEAEEPDYKLVREKAMDVLSRSKDLRAAMHLATAELRLDGFVAFAKVTTYVRRCLEEMWDTCHPELDLDDEDIATMRVNAVLGFADPKSTLRAIRLAPLTQSRVFGSMSILDFEIASGDMPAPETMEAPPTNASVDAALQDTDAEQLAAILAGITTAHDDLLAIDRTFSEKVPGEGPTLDNALSTLLKAKTRLTEATGGDASEADAASQVTEAAGTGGPAPGAPRPVGEISSSKDVTAALDKIIAYYSKNEPSSPVPVLLNRAKSLVNAQFIDIIKDMAPLGLDNVQLIAGRDGEEEDAY